MATSSEEGDGHIDGIQAILQFSDEVSRKAAFDYYWQRFNVTSSERADLNALRLCVQLLPSRPVSAHMRGDVRPTICYFKNFQ